jgi:hypothetical protein
MGAPHDRDGRFVALSRRLNEVDTRRAKASRLQERPINRFRHDVDASLKIFELDN